MSRRSANCATPAITGSSSSPTTASSTGSQTTTKSRTTSRPARCSGSTGGRWSGMIFRTPAQFTWSAADPTWKWWCRGARVHFAPMARWAFFTAERPCKRLSFPSSSPLGRQGPQGERGAETGRTHHQRGPACPSSGRGHRPACSMPTESALARRVLVKIKDPASGKLVFRTQRTVHHRAGRHRRHRAVGNRRHRNLELAYGTPLLVEVLDADDEEILVRRGRRH